MIVDVSQWQRDVDFYKLKEAGVQGAIIRSSYSGKKENDFYLDKGFASYCVDARAADLKVGVYHTSCAESVDKIKAEAHELLEYLNSEKFELPLALHISYFEQRRLDGELLTDMIAAWCEIIQNAGYKAMYYFDSNFISKLNLEALSKYYLWLAHYDDIEDEYIKWDNSIPALMRQYTLRGKFEGVPSIINVSYYYDENESKKAENTIDESAELESITEPALEIFKVGDMVKIKTGAKTYSGKTIYSWVYNNTYKIDKLINDRAILDANGLCTAFNVKDLCKS